MRIAVLYSFFFSMLSMPVFSSNLPPEHESARLLLVIEEAVNQSEWLRADTNLTQIAALDIELPPLFFYYNGLVHHQFERDEKAQRSLEHYVVKSGASGAFYNESLQLLTLIENKGKEALLTEKQQAEEVLADEPPALTAKDHRDTYIQTLKALFLTDEPVIALTMQINSLLSAHPYTGVRLKKADDKQGIKFQVSIQENTIVLQEKNYQKGFPSLSASRLDVSGLDPFITYQCSNKTLSCWLYHPADSHDIWITLDNDQLVANELSQAFTRLIQYLQK